MKRSILFFFTLMILASCQKDDTSSQAYTPEFLPMSVNNYWIYQRFVPDSNDQYHATETYDSLAISRDSIINGNKYFVFERFNLSNKNKTPQPYGIFRDSLSYIVNNYGDIVFASDDFSDTLNHDVLKSGDDIFYETVYKMTEPNSLISVPAGQFKTLNYRGELNLYSNPGNVPNPRFINTHYAENLGMVFRNEFYVLSNRRYELRLARFNLN